MRETAVNTADEFRQWLSRALKGDRCIYHVGHLAADMADDDTRRLERLSRVVNGAAEDGDVAVVQRRDGASWSYRYEAQRLTRDGAALIEKASGKPRRASA